MDHVFHPYRKKLNWGTANTILNFQKERVIDLVMKKIVLTGGGTAGHVTPNIALVPELKKHGFEISYIGSYQGIEKQLIELEKIPYYGISSGKLRRYIDIKNISDPFKVVKGLFQTVKLLKKLKPDIVFSKGGFVSVPVVLAAKLLKIPVIIHESDITPGLANRIAFPSADWVCCNFPETMPYLPEGKAVLTGSPIRSQLLTGDAQKARLYCGFSSEKPVLLIIGGSIGSKVINDAIRDSLPELTADYQLIHLCGKGNIDPALYDQSDYVQYEYIRNELPDFFALADLVISRAGANSICELLALKKPNILIPLSAQASRGDQILNANSFEKQGFSYVILEEDLNAKTLFEAIAFVWQNKKHFIEAMRSVSQSDAIAAIMVLILKTVKKS